MTQANDLLQTLFAGSGLFTESAGGDWLRVGKHPAKIRARATHETPQDNQVAMHIEVDVQLANGKTVTEWYIGQAATRDLAMREAMRQFAISGAHVMLNALWDVPIPGQVETQSWQIGRARWRAWLGPFTIWANEPPGNIAPRNLVDTTRATVSQTQLDPELNWFRFIHCSLGDGKKVISEAAKNNQQWPEGEAMLKSLQWPPLSQYWSLRHFVILTREHS